MNSNKNIFITGGAGYVGSILVPLLLSRGYNVTVLDLFIFGDNVLPSHINLKKIKGDIRNYKLIEENIKNTDVFLHLACISNDPSFEMDPDLGKSINFDCFENILEIAEKHKVKHFIYASSSSVYGLKKQDNVVEEDKLEPLTDYSYYKMKCEEILVNKNYKNLYFTIIRPATVCGYSPRQRLDVVVNIFANLAYHKRTISIFGGEQLRPNLHIMDMSRAYIYVIESPISFVKNEIFNVGEKNYKVLEIAKITKEVMGNDVKLELVDTDDKRSYHISSQKISDKLDFKTHYTVQDAVKDLKVKFIEKKLINTFKNDNYFNIKKINQFNFKY